MRIRALFMLLLLGVMLSIASQGSLHAKTASVQRPAASVAEKWIPVKFEKNVYKYIRNDGSVAIDSQFDDALSFTSNGLAAIKKGGLWGYIKTDGSYAIQPQFEYASRFASNGLALVRKGGLYGYIKTDGSYAIQPQIDDAWNFASNGLALVRKGGLYGYIKTDGSYAIQPQFDGAWNFASNGLAKVKKSSLWGYVKTDGSYAVQPQFDDVRDFALNGLAKVKKMDRWGYIKADGSYAIQPQFDDADDFALNGLAKVKKLGLWGYIKTDGSYAIKPQFEHADDFALNGLAKVQKSSLWAGMDDDGHFFVKRGLWGYIKADGSYAIQPQFEDAGTFTSNGLAIVKNNGKYGFIRSDGSYVAMPTFDKIKDYEFYGQPLAYAEKDGGQCYINTQGQIVVQLYGAYKCPNCSETIRAWVNSKGQIVWPKDYLAKCRAKKIEHDKEIAAAIIALKRAGAEDKGYQKQSRSSSSSSNNRSNNRITTVEIEVIKWDWEVKSFTVSGGPGKCDKWSNDKWWVKPFGKGVAGTYHWTATIGYGSKPDDTDIVCSGTFRLNGNEDIYKIKVYSNGRETTPYIYYYH